MADDETTEEAPSEPQSEAREDQEAEEAAPAHEAHDAPPGLPEIRDEAGDTPRWVPLLGIALLVVTLGLFFGMRFLSGPKGDEAAEQAGAALDTGSADAPQAPATP